jgi:uncharacterized protein
VSKGDWMATGLFALLDDIAVIAKVAAASLDDVAAQAVKTGTKAAGIVIDDAAVTPRYVVGFAADRELPIIAKIAWGSLKNKLLFLLPAALLLTWLAPWAITPLLMIGGAFLCFEGYEKAHEMLHPPAPVPVAVVQSAAVEGVGTQEDRQVASAIRTDFILSAEIMAISLASFPGQSYWMTGTVLAVVGTLVTMAVYGAVALIVKADDVGLALAQRSASPLLRRAGMGLVHGMPKFLGGLSIVGMLAMLWVGGGIILHGLEAYGPSAVPRFIHGVASSVGSVFGPLQGLLTWLVDAASASVIGLSIGWVVERGLAVVHGARH